MIISIVVAYDGLDEKELIKAINMSKEIKFKSNGSIYKGQRELANHIVSELKKVEILNYEVKHP